MLILTNNYILRIQFIYYMFYFIQQCPEIIMVLPTALKTIARFPYLYEQRIKTPPL